MVYNCEGNIHCATCEFSSCVPLAVTKRLLDMIEELTGMVELLTNDGEKCDSILLCSANKQDYTEEISKPPDKDGYTGVIPGECPIRMGQFNPLWGK